MDDPEPTTLCRRRADDPPRPTERLSTGRIAAELGTTRARVHRAVAAGIVSPERTAAGHLRFSTAQLDALRAYLGFVPPIDGLTRQEALVLAALVRRPLGLRSVRAVARAAGVSPTNAGATLTRLRARGLVRVVTQRVVTGRVRDIRLWQADTRHPEWLELAPRLSRVVLPTVGDPVSPPSRIPDYLRHVFWNADPRELNPTDAQDAAVIASRILASDDAQAHAWATAHLPPSAFRRAARARGLDARRVALAQLLAGASRR